MNNHLLPIIHFADQVMSKGKGSYLYDKEGEEYLDLNSGQFCVALGHSNEELLNEVCAKAKDLVHTASNIISDEVVQCADNLARISGDMKASSILLSTGSEAVEFCLRYAKHIRNKSGIVCFDKGYHGLTLGAQSVTFGGKFARPVIQDISSISIPVTDSEAEETLATLDNLLAKDIYAALLVEPIVSVGGMLFPVQKWFDGLRTVCDKHDVLLVFDESQTGFGRTGDWFAYQTYNIMPDMVILSKSVGMGFPVSVAMFTEQIVPQGDEGYAITHYSSHQNDSFAASIINAGIHYIENHDLLSRVESAGTYFLNKLLDLEKKNRHIQNARGKGLMLGCELYYDGISNYRGIYGKLYETMMRKGVIIQGTNGGHTLRFLPDYLIEHSDIDKALDTLDETLYEMESSIDE